MRSVNIPYLPQVDHMRAFAALLILFYHGLFVLGPDQVPPEVAEYAHRLPLFNPLYSLWAEGHTAVALFMVLSGFIFTVGSLGRKVRYGTFVLNRVLRIYPLFVAVLLFNLWTRVPVIDPWTVLGTLLPVADIGPLFAHGRYVEMAWAVSVECQFYLLFPLILGLFERSAWRATAGIIGVALAARLALVLLGFDPIHVSYYHLVGRIDQFVLGMLAAVLYRRLEWNEALFRRVLGWAVPGVVGLIWAFHDLGGGYSGPGAWKILWPTVEGAAWAAVVLGYAGCRQMWPGWLSTLLCRLGEMSFSIYLLHRVVLAYVPARLTAAVGTGRWDMDALLVTTAVVLPVTLLLSFVTFRLIERPFLGLRRRYAADGPRRSPSADLGAVRAPSAGGEGFSAP